MATVPADTTSRPASRVLLLSPAKLLIVLVVALAVLGPDALPKVARQIGDLWRALKGLRQRLESEVRDVFPDLPPTETIIEAVRSPLSFLDSLVDAHAADDPAPAGDAHPTGPSPDPVAPDHAVAGSAETA